MKMEGENTIDLLYENVTSIFETMSCFFITDILYFENIFRYSEIYMKKNLISRYQLIWTSIH